VQRGVGSESLMQSRFRLSPINEVHEVVHRLVGHMPDPVLQPWIDRMRPRFERLRHCYPTTVGLLAQMLDSDRSCPDFITPPTRSEDFDDQLLALRQAPLSHVQEDMDLYAEQRQRSASPALATTVDAEFVNAVADAMGIVWAELMRPQWTMIKTILRQDLTVRATTLIAEGWQPTLAGMTPCIDWQLTSDAEPGVRAYIFGPTLFGCTAISTGATGPHMVTYPARDRARLLEHQPSGPEPLARLLGRTRAEILMALDRPATTTELTKRCMLSLGSVGGHLAALRAAGMIIGSRAGKTVTYERTVLGSELVAMHRL
jgi:DNA-binding transcriptional ArsR family regulator